MFFIRTVPCSSRPKPTRQYSRTCLGRLLVWATTRHGRPQSLARIVVTIKYLAWATTCQMRPATGSFGLTDDGFTCYERPDHANFRQYCRIWSWKLNTKTGGDRKRRSPPKPIVGEYPLVGASSLLFTKALRGRILFIVLELFTLLLAIFASMKMHNLL